MYNEIGNVHNCRLIYETNTQTYYGEGSESYEIVYLYDDTGVVGMAYTRNNVTSTYYFQKNLMGDVVAIYDTNGAKVAGYTYDAWGNCTITSDTTNYTVAYANPFRYRSYYYDSDTNLYYLNARYYSPELRRFISPDDTTYIVPKNANGLNLYCYCNNDPVNFVDPSGHFVLMSLGIFGFFATAGLAVLGAATIIVGVTAWLISLTLKLLIKCVVGLFKGLISLIEFLFDGISSEDVDTITGAAMDGAGAPHIYGQSGPNLDELTIAWE